MKKTGREIKLFRGDCSICKSTKSKNVLNIMTEAEGLGNSFKNIAKGAAKAQQRQQQKQQQKRKQKQHQHQLLK